MRLKPGRPDLDDYADILRRTAPPTADGRR